MSLLPITHNQIAHSSVAKTTTESSASQLTASADQSAETAGTPEFTGIATLSLGSFILMLLSAALILFQPPLELFRSSQLLLSLVFVTAALLHGWSLIRYGLFAKYGMQQLPTLLTGACFVLLALMLTRASIAQTNMRTQAENALFQSQLPIAAAVFELSPDQLQILLSSQGIRITGDEQNLQQIADNNQVGHREIITRLLQ